MEVPGRTNANVVVAVAVPVVDVEAVLVEVADTRDVASVGRRERMLLVPIHITRGIECYRSCEPIYSFPCI